MTDHLAVTRTAEFDLSPDELWALVSDGRRWPDWMVDSAAIDVAPGAIGTVVDDGVLRSVAVRSASGHRLVFEWRPLDGAAADTTVVELEVTPTDDGGSRLRVMETSASAHDAIGFAWDLRLLAMCSCVAMCCRT